MRMYIDRKGEGRMKIGFIGFGNMAQALAKGLVLKGGIEAGEIYAYDTKLDVLNENANSYSFHPVFSANDLVSRVDMVIIAVKPHVVEMVVKEIKGNLQGKILVSIAVNVPFAKYEQILEPNTHHISILPNTPVAVGEGAIVYENKHSLTDDELASFVGIFSKIALVQEVDTENLGIAGTITGCGPAFASMFIEALSDAAVKHGLPRELSYKLASKMLAGTAKLQLESGEHPGVMKDKVCSPGGTTIVGVTTLEGEGFRSAVIEAVDAIQEK